MALKRELEFVIAEDGALTVTTRGYQGADCDAAIAPFEKALGKVQSKKRTRDYHARSTQQRTTIGSKTE